jgi:integrase
LRRHNGERLDTRTAYFWVRAIGVQAGLDRVHPHMLRAAFIMAALDAGVPLRLQIAARHADPRTTTVYDRRRQSYDRHAAYAVVAFDTRLTRLAVCRGARSIAQRYSRRRESRHSEDGSDGFPPRGIGS